MKEALVPEEEQPYKVPENWVWIKLGSIVEFKGGGTPSKDNSSYWDGHIPWASVKDVKGLYLEETKDSITEEGLRESSASIAEPGELLLITRMSPGKSTISKIRAAINQDLKIVKPKVELSPYLLWMYFSINTKMIEYMSTGSTVKGIQISKLSEMKISLPPLNEQKRIADKVERLLDKVNQAKQLIEEAQATFELRRAAILDKAFRGELTEKWQSVQCETQFTGETPYTLPEGWRWSTVEAICEDIIDCPHSTPKYIEEGIPALRTSDIGFAKIDLSNSKKVSEEEYMERTKRTIPKYGDVVYCREGAGIMVNAGNAGMIEDQKICLAQRLVLLRPNPSIVQYKYFMFGMNSLFIFKQAMKNVSQTTSPRVNISAIRKFMFPVAPIEVQTEIIKKIETLLEKESFIDFESLVKILGKLEKSIISKSFRGELGTNDPNEESSLELLKSILSLKVI